MQRIPSWPGARSSPTKAEYICADQLAGFTFRLQKSGGPYICSAAYTYYGTSKNATKTQIWIAVSVYVLVAIVCKQLGLEATIYQLLQILNLTLFEKTPILQTLQPSDFDNDLYDSGNQLILFDL